MMWGYYTGWPFWGGGMFMIMIIFWVVFIGLILAGLNYLFNPKTGVSQAALDVLKARYAKGEINQEEFKKIKKDLSE